MQFYSLEFLAFFICVCILFFCLSPKRRSDILLITSLAFYAFFSVVYLAILIGIILFTYYIGHKVGAGEKSERQKKFLVYYILVVVSLLLLFKYASGSIVFFNAIVSYLGVPYRLDAISVILPVGLSFYSLKALSYIIDVYRGEIEPEGNLKDLAGYLAYFPEIIAGPIDRAKGLIRQFKATHVFDGDRVISGLVIIVWGLFKKLVIADRLGIVVDTVFDDPEKFSGFYFVVASVFYTFQIYYDFSGYTDIAIGISRVLGLTILQNFNRPYASRSISEFWRRWHISLSTWLRDYVYIPLGGNRVANYRRLINVLATFTVCGIWHGNRGTFFVWGVLHGFFIIFSIGKGKVYEKLRLTGFFNRIPRVHVTIQVISTFLIVSFAWIFFRAQSISDALYILANFFSEFGIIFQTSFNEILRPIGLNTTTLVMLIILLLFAEVISFLSRERGISEYILERSRRTSWGFCITLLIFICLFGVFKHSEFIYAQF